jgi:hypothetical protein
MVKATTLLAVLPLVYAWPEVMEHLHKREEPPPREPLFLSKRPNTSQPPLTFNAAEQFVDVSEGSGHEFQSPRSGDIRGQCPGLNAASNHGFLPRNGIVNTQQSELSQPSLISASDDVSHSHPRSR